MQKIINVLQYDFSKQVGEKYDLEKEPSLTVPDETLSIRELLYRYTSGIVPFESRELPYDNDDVTIDDDVNPINDWEMSLTDIHNKAIEHYNRYQELLDVEKQKQENEAGKQVEETK